MSCHWSHRISCFCSTLLLAAGICTARAQDRELTVSPADPNLQSDGTMSKTAAAALARGPLPMSQADVDLKRAANADHDAAVAAGRMRPGGLRPVEASGQGATAQAPAVIGGLSFAGLSDPSLSPSDSTGTIGTTRYIQTVNAMVGIYNRSTQALIATGTLNQLAGNGGAVSSFDPQMMWDPTTNRFYYLMDSIVSSAHHKLAFGFSKTAFPASVSSADWCQYTIDYGSSFPEFPKLGDSRFFIIIGVNTYNNSDVFLGSDIMALRKPAAGSTCPAFSTFNLASKTNIKDSSNHQTFTPVPANQVDTNNIGYVVARNGAVPSTQLWFYSVTRDASGNPVIGNGRGLTVPSYTIPPAATQPTFSQKIDTSDARPTQAVQAINPDRSGIHSFWMQLTVKHPSEPRSIVRWYEIDPAPAMPVLLRSGAIGIGSANSGNFFYNASISPDRRKDRGTVQFGNSFAIQYNLSSRVNGVSPGIFAGSSVSGGPLSFSRIKSAVGPYRDFTCRNPGDTCRWGDYSSAMPDPRPTTAGRGEIWTTNQYSGVVNPSTASADWRTWIAAVRP
jgi:hypothetical protein